MGKGSRQRPSQVSQEEIDLRYKLIWASDKEKKKIKKKLEELKSK